MANPIEDDEELARAVGILAGRWGLVEFYMASIFTLLSGTGERKSHILFSYFKPVGTQCDVIRAMLDETPNVTEQTRIILLSILADYRELAPKRNAILHYPFGWDESSGTKELYKVHLARKGEKLIVSTPTSAKEIMKVAGDVDLLMLKISLVFSLDFWMKSPESEPAERLRELFRESE